MTLAQNATFYRRVKELLDSWGWGKATELYPGWATRSNSGVVMMPQAVTVHHTGGRATATSYLVNPADRPQLKVLANVHITHGHRIRFICAGGASHGGYTHEPCYQRVVQGTAPLDRDLDPGADSRTFSINKRTVGIEIDGAGGPKEWDEWTYRAAVATSAACQIAGGWPVKGSPRVGAHKEHTRRKPGDPYAPMGKFRRDVLDCLANPWTPTGYLNPTDKENNPKPPTKGGWPFPLPARHYFGPKEGTDRSVSGYYQRKFKGWTDRHWLREWQRQAKAIGLYAGNLDGLYGPQTAEAARKVQRRIGIEAHGLITKRTWSAVWRL